MTTFRGRPRGDVLVVPGDVPPRGGYRPLCVAGDLVVLVRPGFGVGTAGAGDVRLALVGATVEPLPAAAGRLAADLASRPGDDAAGTWAAFGTVLGHVAAVVVRGSAVVTVTDHLGTIPVYVGRTDAGRIAGTDLVDVASLVDGSLDSVSVAEFVRDGIVTSPHTVFAGVRRQPPATTADVRSATAGAPCWMPPAPEITDVAALAPDLDRALADTMHVLAGRTTTATVAYSGGEDSRIVAAYARRVGIAVSGVTFLDAPNREHRHARLAARASGIRLVPRRRSADHDAIGLAERVRAMGPGVDALHAHAHGLLDPVGDPMPVLDGWFATVLKAEDAPVERRHVRAVPVGFGRVQRPLPAPDADVPAIEERRHRKLALLDHLPEASRHEWAVLWPCSDAPTFGWFAFGQVSFPALSPFLLRPVVELAARVDPACRLDRRLVRAAFADRLGWAAWVPRTDGEILALPPRLDVVIAAGNKVRYKVGERIRRRNNGPWQSNALRSAAADLAVAGCHPDAIAAVEETVHDVGARARGWAGRHRVAQVASILDATTGILGSDP